MLAMFGAFSLETGVLFTKRSNDLLITLFERMGFPFLKKVVDSVVDMGSTDTVIKEVISDMREVRKN